jgi:hypothetical protein
MALEVFERFLQRQRLEERVAKDPEVPAADVDEAEPAGEEPEVPPPEESEAEAGEPGEEPDEGPADVLPEASFERVFEVLDKAEAEAEAAAEEPGGPWEGEPNAMEIEEIPRTFSLRVSEQELTALTKAVCSWLDNSTGEDPAAETLSDMYQQLSALEESAAEVPEAAEEEAAEDEAAYEEE